MGRAGWGLAAVGAVSVLVACGASRAEFEEAPPPAPTEGTPPAPPLDNGDQDHRTVSVGFEGTVYAPNGTLPLANALVYVTAQPPAAIPQQTYCDECVTLPENTFALSDERGHFELTTSLAKGKAYVVVQKGQFRRVRAVEITKEGLVSLEKEKTTLPGRADTTAGDDVPRMIVLKDDSDYDAIDASLSKLGINAFEMRSDRSLLKNRAELLKYHVVFVPCGDNEDTTASDPTAKANLQEFVKAGGKLYVTDWSYEFVRQPFPSYVNWVGATATLGSAAGYDEWDAPATANDEGLGKWLAANGDPTFSVIGNWTKISALGTVPTTDAKGAAVDVTPKVWVSAKVGNTERPTTVSFENQCGRVLFSTYHTESGDGLGGPLTAQEKALLYVLLEVGVCVGKGPGVN